MEKYMVNLERFYGPLDLLLYLVEKDEMDIYDVSISSITDQYMVHIQQAENIDVEKMTAFLQMATFLLQLKSQMLLPKEQPVFQDESGSPGTDPQAELISRIILYKQFKIIAGMLDERQQEIIERAFFRPSSSLPEAVQVSFHEEKDSLKKAMHHIQRRKHLYQSLTLPFRDLRIEDKMEGLWQKIQQAGSSICFSDTIEDMKDRREVTASFLALLELLRRQKIEVVQRGLFQEILIRAAAGAR